MGPLRSVGMAPNRAPGRREAPAVKGRQAGLLHAPCDLGLVPAHALDEAPELRHTDAATLVLHELLAVGIRSPQLAPPAST